MQSPPRGRTSTRFGFRLHKAVWWFFAIAMALMVALFACTDLSGLNNDPPASTTPDSGPGEGETSIAPAQPGFDVQVTIASSVVQGKDVAFDVQLTRRGGFNELVNVTLSSLPAGVSAQPPLLIIPSGSNTATGKVSTTLATPQGSHTVAVAASAGGGLFSASTTFKIDVQGPPGSLDTTFGDAGAIVEPTPIYGVDRMHMEQDGHFIACGSAAYQPPNGYPLSIWRFKADGTRESTFGDGGVVTIAFPPEFVTCSDLIVTPDGGKILVTVRPGFRVLRFDSKSGALDTTFADAGVYAGLGGGSKGEANGVYSADGGIFVGGSDLSSQLIVVRLMDNGAVDTSFGDAGAVTISSAGFTSSVANAFSPMADGQIAVGGVIVSNSQQRTFVGRLNSVSVPGTSLAMPDDAGVTVTRMALAAGLFVTGTSNANNADRAYVAKYRDRGLPLRDSTFGNQGVQTVASGYASFSRDVLVDGSTITLCGTHRKDVTFTHDIMVVRYLASGVIDTSFGNQGVSLIDLGFNDIGSAGCSFTSDGRILVVGVSQASPTHLVMTRVWR